MKLMTKFKKPKNQPPSTKNLSLILLLTLTLAITHTTCHRPPKNPNPQNSTSPTQLPIPFQYGNNDVEKYRNIGKNWVCTMVTVQIFAFIFQLQDIFSRSLFRLKLRWQPAQRIILLLFAVAASWYVGRYRPYKNSGAQLDKPFFHWFDRTYGTYGSTGASVLPMPITKAGCAPQSFHFDRFNYVNRQFVPLVFFYLLYVSKLGARFSGALKEKRSWAQLVGAVDWIYSWGFSISLAGWAVLWFSQFFEILRFNEEWAKDDDARIDVLDVNYLVGWLVAGVTFLVVNWECFWSIWVVVYKWRVRELQDGKKGKNKNKKQNQVSGDQQGTQKFQKINFLKFFNFQKIFNRRLELTILELI